MARCSTVKSPSAPRDITRPGFVEADTGAPCGHSFADNFVWSLMLSDIDTGWTECRATWNKGAHGVVAHIKAIERALPFTLRGVDCDNVSEFLNHHLLHYFEAIHTTRLHPFTPLPEQRQCPRRTKQLEPRPPAVRLRPLRECPADRPDVRCVRPRVESATTSLLYSQTEQF